ncbi:unnamed protein product [Phytophthora fragariaefolia]|uniref:Unnamed protein product n=1 Tax=Phytophthora fragariaefolia TaxID=1490495 RepID=A0A9W6YFP4_9STRA|nr:unnamed protein product [Phytophthora fragariaefolia]
MYKEFKLNFTHPQAVKHESGKGCMLDMSHGEVLRTHQSGLSGSGFWGDLWNGIKKGASSVWGFLKENWRPLTSTALDIGSKYGGPEAVAARETFRQVSGLGMVPASQASPEILAKPIPRRAMKGKGFRLTGKAN